MTKKIQKPLPVPEPHAGTCYACGCTDDRACIDGRTPCRWSNPQHTLCSRCTRINNRVDVMQMKGWI